MSKKKKSVNTDRKINTDTYLDYKVGYPRTGDETSSYSAQRLQDAITRDSTTVANKSALYKWWNYSSQTKNVEGYEGPADKVQINREYLQKKKGYSDTRMREITGTLPKKSFWKRGGKIGDEDLGSWKASYKLGGRTYKS
tara:strand:- start:82 stop:501 length:420 start_codon:yes stop_codon:yes gene_type:complete